MLGSKRRFSVVAAELPAIQSGPWGPFTAFEIKDWASRL
jgi:hypothetical protein